VCFEVLDVTVNQVEDLYESRNAANRKYTNSGDRGWVVSNKSASGDFWQGYAQTCRQAPVEDMSSEPSTSLEGAASVPCR